MGFASEIVTGRMDREVRGDQRDTPALSVSFHCTQHIGQSRPGQKVELSKVAGEAKKGGTNPSTGN